MTSLNLFNTPTINQLKITLLTLITLSLLMALTNTQAQEPSPNTENPTLEFPEIKLIQPYTSKIFGNLKLPSFWGIQESDNHLQAIQQHTTEPATINIFIINKTPPLRPTTLEILVHNLQKNIFENLKNPQLISSRPLEAIEKNIPHFLQITGIEDNIERTYAMLILPSSPMLIFTFSATNAQAKNLNLAQLLLEILTNME